MKMKSLQVVNLALGAFALLLWLVMFLAGTDVWHAVQRPDFWNLQGPPYADVRAFAYAFYLLLAVLSLNLFVTVAGVVAGRAERRQTA